MVSLSELRGRVVEDCPLAEVVNSVIAVTAKVTVSLMDARRTDMLNLPLEAVPGDARFAHLRLALNTLKLWLRP